jgi:hypothetical protein
MNELHDLAEWDRASPSAREATAKRIADLCPGFRLRYLRSHQHGNHCHEIAFYDHEGKTLFALIPSSDATLGYDRTNPWTPDEDERAAWEAFSSDYPDDLPQELSDYIEAFLTPMRRALIKPHLLQVEADPVGVRRLRADDPLIDPQLVSRRPEAVSQISGTSHNQSDDSFQVARSFGPMAKSPPFA